jgi:TetR/AcrR family transcriptional repressor of mexCD-oprJ operon
MPTRPAVSGAPLNSRTGRTTTAILDAAARVFAERGSSAHMADVAAAAGVGRATLYRHFPDREALFDALASHAIADSAARLADAGLERAPVAEAIERIVRAVTSIGDRYAVLASEHVESDPAEVERLLAAPVRAVLTRGIESGFLRQDLPPDVLFELFRGVLGTAIQLMRQGRLGAEEASAAAASVFLDGVRAQ